MSRYAAIQDGVIDNVIVAAGKPGGPWVSLAAAPKGAGIGWLYDGEVFTPPPPRVVLPRNVVATARWVDSWTPAEWAGLKTERGKATAAGRDLDQQLSAIDRLSEFNLASARADKLYGGLVASGFLTQDRADELRANKG